MPEISLRGMQVPASPIRKLAPLSDAAKAKGIKVYHLNIGQPDLPSPKAGVDALKEIDREVLEYSPSDGYRDYRENLVKYYAKLRIDLKPEEIIVTAGGSEALLYAFLSCLNPGDEVIMTEPIYANYISFGIAAGIIIKTIPAKIETGFALPEMEELEQLISPATKALLICNPNNPTGYVYSQEEMRKVCELVKKHDIFLFSDEVYREFIYSGTPYISACHLAEIEQNVVLIDSVSKRYSECGIRIGALITKNRNVREAVMKFCQARLSPPLLGQIVANASLDAGETYMQHNYNEYKNRRDFLIERLNKIPGVFSPMPMGAFYTVASLPVDNADDFCAWCLSDFSYENQTVFMAPASGFYVTPGLGKNEVRIAYVLKTEELAKAMDVLEKALEAYRNR